MSDITAQEIFDKVVTHLRTQGEQASILKSDGGYSCRYRTEDGLKCAVGCLIPDDDYSPSMEGTYASSVISRNRDKLSYLSPHLALLDDLQAVHDDRSHWSVQGFSSSGEGALASIALSFSLTYTPRTEAAQ